MSGFSEHFRPFGHSTLEDSNQSWLPIRWSTSCGQTQECGSWQTKCFCHLIIWESWCLHQHKFSSSFNPVHWNWAFPLWNMLAFFFFKSGADEFRGRDFALVWGLFCILGRLIAENSWATALQSMGLGFWTHCWSGCQEAWMPPQHHSTAFVWGRFFHSRQRFRDSQLFDN